MDTYKEDISCVPGHQNELFWHPERDVNTFDGVFSMLMFHMEHLLSKLDNIENIKLARKWIKIFCESSPNEKCARNCLLIVMLDQLHSHTAISKPFTEIDDPHPNLESLLCNLDDMNFELAKSVLLDLAEDFKNQKLQPIPNDADENNEPSVNSSMNVGDFSRSFECKSDLMAKQCACNELLFENALLRQELESLRMELTDQKMENFKIMSAMANHTANQQIITNSGNVFIETIKDYLPQITAKKGKKLNVLQNLFSSFATDKDFLNQIRKLDADFEKLIKVHFRYVLKNEVIELERSIREMERKKRQKLFESFQTGLKMQNLAQRLEMGLNSLKIISEARNIVLTYATDHDRKLMLQALQALENRCEKEVPWEK